jgi:hypothetical protein
VRSAQGVVTALLDLISGRIGETVVERPKRGRAALALTGRRD